VQTELLKDAFEKARKEGADNTGNSIASEIHRTLESTENPPITADAIRGYFRKHSNNDSFNISRTSKDQLARYLGYKNFRDYVKKNRENGSKISRYLLWVLIVALGGSLTWNFFGGDAECCMIWVEDHWEETECSGKSLERACDPNTLEKMKLVEVCKNALVKKDGQQILWYDKTNKKVTFFTYHGLHPINGKTLKEANSDMVEKYGKECD
jgi:hypothetical protein